MKSASPAQRIKSSSKDRPAAAGRSRRNIRRVDLVYAELASITLVREMNRNLVLELIRTKQPISRAEISRITGLHASTVSSIVDQLLEEKWVVTGAASRLPRGRWPTMLSLNANMLVLVADIRPDRAVVAVMDLNGLVITSETLPLISDPERGVRNIIARMQQLIQQFASKAFQGIGIILPGRVNSGTQRLVFSPKLPWTGYEIKKEIEAAIPLRVELDNDANACMLSELWFGHMDGVQNATLITITDSIGTAILANGQLVTGRNGLAGEFGHISLDPAGPVCSCGRSGCWEALASDRAATEYYASLQGVPRPTSYELLNLAENGDEQAVAALRRQATYIGQGLRIVVSTLSPEVILINGSLTTSWDRFGPIVQEELDRSIRVGGSPRIIVSSDVKLARLRGALAIALQRRNDPVRHDRGPFLATKTTHTEDYSRDTAQLVA